MRLHSSCCEEGFLLSYSKLGLLNMSRFLRRVHITRARARARVTRYVRE
jgi:hypothetical protein